ncbi:MAG TPA: DNA-processing protein DprA [Cytophagaceae bacterium]|jgi:DNA processing protein|nr:DNA-processing protein DprA [Cytophagaceae bacterium]
MQELLYQVALSQVNGVGLYNARQLITYCGGIQQIFSTPSGKLSKIPGIKDQVTQALKDPEIFRTAENILQQCERNHIDISFITDDHYPKRLKEIEDAPLLLFHKGTIDTDHTKTIAVVGTRKASAYGKECLENMLQELAPWNPVVVSGLAYGIDITAHKICLDIGLRTIAVLGSGIRNIYPSLHKNIANTMCEQGGLISEYSPNTKPEMYHFPARNRIIAGLCEGIIVAEAGEKGGALITAQLANSYNREVMAIPGNLKIITSAGCNNLIKNNQAHLITSGKDVAELLNWDVGTTGVSKFKLKDTQLLASLSEDERKLYHYIEKEEGIQLDNLAWKSGINISRTANLLLQLEMHGLIEMLPGKKIKTT